MKKLFLSVCIALALCSCGDNSNNINTEIEQTVTNSLKKRARNPDALKIESIEIKKDTLPYYFNKDIIDQAEDTYNAYKKWAYYKDMGYYWRDEKTSSEWAFQLEVAELGDIIASEKAATQNEPTIAYIANVRFSGTNAIGGVVSNRCIYGIDTSDTSKILCSYNIDSDFVEKWMIIKMIENNSTSAFTTDRFGNYDTSKMSFVEQFLMED
jgi:hypothetical protein